MKKNLHQQYIVDKLKLLVNPTDTIWITFHDVRYLISHPDNPNYHESPTYKYLINHKGRLKIATGYCRKQSWPPRLSNGWYININKLKGLVLEEHPGGTNR